jgi:hypothetical protein
LNVSSDEVKHSLFISNWLSLQLYE